MKLSNIYLKSVAVLYQCKPPPLVNGIQKPMKPGGYSDSGADIAYQLQKFNVSIITPVESPVVNQDFDWVFPDSPAGIDMALKKGAKCFWLNTILYKGHSVEAYFGRDIEFVGQLPALIEKYDDKLLTNNLLRKNGLTVLPQTLISNDQKSDMLEGLDFPCVIKPVRGRGSQGVVVAQNRGELSGNLERLFLSKKYGNSLYIENYLTGQEITVTVMPPGRYYFGNKVEDKTTPWSMPAVKRINHKNGVIPWNGDVPVTENSFVMEDDKLASEAIRNAYVECEKAFSMVEARAPIRIDCRADKDGKYWLFDLNMKPNITGACRPHRQNQDSLTAIAARKIGWSYGDLLANIVEQRWKC
eukprot:TCONS_00053747-protein